jgi:hypothetical protein
MKLEHAEPNDDVMEQYDRSETAILLALAHLGREARDSGFDRLATKIQAVVADSSDGGLRSITH